MPFEVKTDELFCEVAKFLGVAPNRIRFEGYSWSDENDETEVCINGNVDLGYLQITFMACVNKEGDGYITFQLVPFESVKIENHDEWAGEEGVWNFEVKNYKICTKYARYGL